MKITLVFINGGAAVAKFEDSTYTYSQSYENMKSFLISAVIQILWE